MLLKQAGIYSLMKDKDSEVNICRGGGTSSNLGGPLLNFFNNALLAVLRATSLALVHRCISGSQYEDKLSIDLSSSITGSSTSIIRNFSLNCGF